MATKKFTQFSTATPLTTGDYIVGYKEDGSEELKTTVKQIIDLVQDSDNQTLNYNNGNLSISSGNSVTLSSFNAVNAQAQLLSAGTDLFDIFLTSETDSQTLSFNETSKDLSISSGNTVSLSSFTANTDFDSYKTNVASATATLLPTTIYQGASGFWQAASTATSQASANTILAGGNTRGAITTIGTNDAFNFRLETNNTTRINILSSGFVGIGTANNDSRVTERLTVDGNINLRETGTETRYLEIGTGRTGNGNSYIDLIGDATHSDFGTRILREDTGPNANSYIRHRGTGNLVFEAINTGSLKFFTASAERGTIDSVGNFSFGNVLPNERLTVSGNISATGVVYAQDGNSTQWNLASSAAINYTHTNFLPLTGGIISGETRINNNLTVFGNISATGTTTFANTVFSTTSALSVVHIGSGPAMWVGNNGDGDIASFYDIDSNVEVLHVGGNTGSFPNVGVKTSTPNKDFTVNGEISASNTIYDNVGNSNQWNTAYQNVSSQSLNKTDKVNFNELGVGTNNPLYFNLDVNGQAGNGTIGSSYGDLGLGATGSINIYPNNYLVLSPVNNIIVRPSGDTTTLPNERFTVIGNISSSNVIYDNVGNSTQWNTAYNVATTYQSASSSFALNTAVASATATLLPLAGGTLTGNLTVNGTVSASSTIFSAGRRAVTTNTTTVPGTSAVTSILAVSALPVVQETGVLYILI